MMKGIVYTEMGEPEVLKVREVEKPIPADNQILVKVKASSVNATDYAPFESAVKNGKVTTLFKVKEKIKDKKVGKVLGGEISGIVEDVGKNVSGFKIGDEVYGVTPGLVGAWAEYVCMNEAETNLKPTNLSFEEAATVPMAGTTALAAISKANVKKGNHVLVYGASGGVGQYVVQILKAYGAEVTGVCSTRNLELVLEMGADHVVDYKKEDIFASENKYDRIIAVNGYNFITKYKKLLTENGIYVAVGGALQGLQGGLFGPFVGIGSNKKFTFSTYFTEIKNGSLIKLKEIIEAGKVVPYIDEVCKLEDTAKAIRNIIERHPQGKVTIRIR